MAIIIPDNLAKQIDKRTDTVKGGISDAMRKAIERYYYLLDIARIEIKDKFTGGELSLICDLCNGTVFITYSLISGITANVYDAEPEYFEKWKCDKQPLLDKLDKLTPLQQAALVDAVERFWAEIAKHATMEQPHPGEILN
jgi:hypothetical protein